MPRSPVWIAGHGSWVMETNDPKQNPALARSHRGVLHRPARGCLLRTGAPPLLHHLPCRSVALCPGRAGGRRYLSQPSSCCSPSSGRCTSPPISALFRPFSSPSPSGVGRARRVPPIPGRHDGTRVPLVPVYIPIPIPLPEHPPDALIFPTAKYLFHGSPQIY